MNEEQAVLDFFAKPENLPLGLSVAKLMDEIRQRLNSDLWIALKARISTQAQFQTWHTELIEDRNAAEIIVGLQCHPQQEQPIYLFPVMEQQLLGDQWRIFLGLMWLTAPTSEQLALPAVTRLKSSLTQAGYTGNERFLGWQWTRHYPRRNDFLLRCSEDKKAVLDEVDASFNALLAERTLLIKEANDALGSIPRSMTISLDQLRKKRAD